MVAVAAVAVTATRRRLLRHKVLRAHPRPVKLESALSKSPWWLVCTRTHGMSEETRAKFFLPSSQVLAGIFSCLVAWAVQRSHTPALKSSSVQPELRQFVETATAAPSSDFKRGHLAGIQIGSRRQWRREKAASEFITDSRVISPATHFLALSF